MLSLCFVSLTGRSSPSTMGRYSSGLDLTGEKAHPDLPLALEIYAFLRRQMKRVFQSQFQVTPSMIPIELATR